MNKKTFPLSHLVKVAGLSQSQTLALLKKLDVEPLRTITTGKMTYRHYDAAAMEKLQAWRVQREAEMGRRDPPVVDAPLASATEPVDTMTVPSQLVFADALTAIQAAQARQGQASAAHATLVNGSLARLEVAVGNLQRAMEDLGHLVLNAMTQPTTAPGVLDRAVGNGTDDARHN